MKLKIYADRLSQPSRAVLIFCKLNGIDFEEITVDFVKRQTQSPEFKEINPMAEVPAIMHGDFKLFESHAILRYLACAFPGVADHWYPTDLIKRAKIDSVLDWHHSNLRRGEVCKYPSNRCHNIVTLQFVCARVHISQRWSRNNIRLSILITLVQNTALATILGRQPGPHVVPEAEKLLSASLEKIETFWLKENEQFLLGNSQPSIADLSLVCEIMQLEVMEEEDRNRILGPHKKVQQWIEDTKLATRPHFEEFHGVLYQVKAKLQKQQLLGANTET